MKQLLEKLKMTKELLTIIAFFIGIIIAGYVFLMSISTRLSTIEKTTLKTIIPPKLKIERNKRLVKFLNLVCFSHL